MAYAPGSISLRLTHKEGSRVPRARKSYTYFYSSKLAPWYHYLTTTLGVELELPLARLKIVTNCSIAVQIEDFITYFKQASIRRLEGKANPLRGIRGQLWRAASSWPIKRLISMKNHRGYSPLAIKSG